MTPRNTSCREEKREAHPPSSRGEGGEDLSLARDPGYELRATFN